MPVQQGARVALDTVTLIYFFEDRGRYVELAGEFFGEIERGCLFGVISSLAMTEFLIPYFKRNDHNAIQVLKNELAAFPHLEIVDLGQTIALEAARLRAEYGLKTPDAVHGATALVGKADVFVTNDKRLRCLEREKLQVWLFDDHAGEQPA